MAHRQKIRKILLKEGVITEKDDIDALTTEAEQKNIDVEEYIAQLKKVPQQMIYQAVAKGFGVDYINLQNVVLEKNLLQLLPESIVQTHQTVIFDRNPKKKLLSLATRDPDDIQTLDFIQKKTGSDLQVFYTDSASITYIIKQYHKSLEEEIQTLTEAPIDIDSYKGLQELNRIARDVPIVKVIDVLLDYASYEGASDIHIEPREKELLVRYRIDGILIDVMTLPKSLLAAMVARIKVLANLKIDEHRLPQDGRFRITIEDKKIAFRVSIFPVYYGEKAVLRLLDESAKVLTFEQLGMHEAQAEIVRRNIKKPHGEVLVTGPTGSGKTTTLYSILNILNSSKVNIATIEDPIEYQIQRVNQSQVSPKIGFTFAAGLRALLRQDPNIIMVGEIRDSETASISAHAAMTGHLVLSTLHTNDAVGAIPRLTEMGVPHFLVASTTNLIIAQRLVRKICNTCRLTLPISKELIAEVERQFSFDDVLSILEKYGELEKGTPLEDIHFYKGKGCEQCGNRGYKGRIGIYEVLEVSDAISKLILAQAPAEKIVEKSHDDGMMTMLEDGLIKAKKGVTTIEEILRVTKE